MMNRIILKQPLSFCGESYELSPNKNNFLLKILLRRNIGVTQGLYDGFEEALGRYALLHHRLLKSGLNEKGSMKYEK